MKRNNEYTEEIDLFSMKESRKFNQNTDKLNGMAQKIVNNEED